MAPFVIDLDATLVTCRSAKQDAAPTWKRTFGFHPLLAIDAARREVLALLIRPGNAGSNTAIDHVTVLGQAVDALALAERAGHQPGDDPTTVQVSGLVRADAGGASHWLAEECRDRNLAFSLGFFCDGRTRDALLLCQEEDWIPARETDGRRRPGAYVIELTALVDLAAWPERTRLIVRRERPHPGAQLSLFDDHEGWRHTCFITDQTSPDIAQLEARHRQGGAAETVIRDVKACGLDTLPSEDVVNNETWALLATAALNLTTWTCQLTLAGTALARATPKTLRYKLWHTAGRLHCGHRLEDRIRARVLLCWLALLLIRLAETATGDTWRNLRHELDRMHRVTLATDEGVVVQRTATTARQAAILRDLMLAEPPRFFDFTPGR